MFTNIFCVPKKMTCSESVDPFCDLRNIPFSYFYTWCAGAWLTRQLCNATAQGSFCLQTFSSTIFDPFIDSALVTGWNKISSIFSARQVFFTFVCDQSNISCFWPGLRRERARLGRTAKATDCLLPGRSRTLAVSTNYVGTEKLVKHLQFH